VVSSADPVRSPDCTVPSAARIYDYLLDGKDHFAADREAARRVIATFPEARALARANRRFLTRAVWYLAEHGIRQYIDLGSGLPTSPNVHEVARQVLPDSRVVYVDNDSMVAAHGRAMCDTDDGVAFIEQTGCVSCHHNSVVSMAVAAARANGYTVNEATAKRQTSTIGVYLESWRERTVQNVPIAGQADTISYLLFGMAADKYSPDAATDAQAIWLKRRQARDGHWAISTIRPPIESNDIEVTAVSMRALQVFAPPSRRAEYAGAVNRARAWLTNAKARSTEERAFRLLGLWWADASKEVVKQAARDLLAGQRDDGGWAQLETMGSDAYATGEALVALRQSGASAPNDRAYGKGLEFLLRTQIDDGSWLVETGAVPIQAYFESGFPYGVNQWISAAATAWATTALALAR